MQPDAPTLFSFATGTAVAVLVMFHGLQHLGSVRHRQATGAGGGNPAYLLVQGGHVLSVLLLVPGISREALAHGSAWGAIAWAAAFAAAGVCLIQVVGGLGIRLLLGGALEGELEKGNVAAGVAGGANFVAVGILAAPAIAGSDLRGLGLSVAFFGIAVVTLAAYVALFRALTTYDDAQQVRGENLAAALSYAGVTVAVAILLARALKGDFEGWQSSLAGYGRVAATALALYPVRQLLVQGVVLGRAPTLRGGALDVAIGVERNCGMAVLEALAYVATAIAIAELT